MLFFSRHLSLVTILLLALSSLTLLANGQLLANRDELDDEYYYDLLEELKEDYKELFQHEAAESLLSKTTVPIDTSTSSSSDFSSPLPSTVSFLAPKVHDEKQHQENNQVVAQKVSKIAQEKILEEDAKNKRVKKQKPRQPRAKLFGFEFGGGAANRGLRRNRPTRKRAPGKFGPGQLKNKPIRPIQNRRKYNNRKVQRTRTTTNGPIITSSTIRQVVSSIIPQESMHSSSSNPQIVVVTTPTPVLKISQKLIPEPGWKPLVYKFPSTPGPTLFGEFTSITSSTLGNVSPTTSFVPPVPSSVSSTSTTTTTDALPTTTVYDDGFRPFTPKTVLATPASPVKYYPNNTIVIQYGTAPSVDPLLTLEKIADIDDNDIDDNDLDTSGLRTVRATTSPTGAIEFRLAQLQKTCPDVTDVLIELLSSPIRKQRRILAQLKVKSRQGNAPELPPPGFAPKAAVSQTRIEFKPPISQPTTIQPAPTPKEIVRTQFSNFPGFQQKVSAKVNKPVNNANVNNRNNGNNRNNRRQNGNQVNNRNNNVQGRNAGRGRSIEAQNLNNRANRNNNQNAFTRAPVQQKFVQQPPTTRFTTRFTTTTTTTTTTRTPRQFIPKQITPDFDYDQYDGEDEDVTAPPEDGTFTIEEFLERYPEVKRLSSRFGGGKGKKPNRGGENVNKPNGNANNQNRSQKQQRLQQRKQQRKQQQQRPRTTTPTFAPNTPVPAAINLPGFQNDQQQNQKLRQQKQQEEREQRQREQRERKERERQQRQKEQREREQREQREREERQRQHEEEKRQQEKQRKLEEQKERLRKQQERRREQRKKQQEQLQKKQQEELRRLQQEQQELLKQQQQLLKQLQEQQKKEQEKLKRLEEQKQQQQRLQQEQERQKKEQQRQQQQQRRKQARAQQAAQGKKDRNTLLDEMREKLRKQQAQSTFQPPPPPTTRRPVPPPTTTRRPQPPPTQRQTKNPFATTRTPKAVAKPQSSNDVDFVDDDDELSSLDYSYLYSEDYYEELVPEHHRFQELATRKTTPQPVNNRFVSNNFNGNNNNNNRNNANNDVTTSFPNFPPASGNSQPLLAGFSNNQQNNQEPVLITQPRQQNNRNNINIPNLNTRVTQNIQVQKNQKSTLDLMREKLRQGSQNNAAPVQQALAPAPVQNPGAPSIEEGPFGYTDKGTFFTDSFVTGFPERIEVIYQGFVWAMEMRYPDEGKIMHGGVHHIIKDKVKREKINLKGDHIVRVSGRSSPYNINRLTLYTAKGKKYGPYGDRRSEDSVDFDVKAPAGQALAFISGTVDFGVPFRSISFHWRPFS